MPGYCPPNCMFLPPLGARETNCLFALGVTVDGNEHTVIRGGLVY